MAQTQPILIKQYGWRLYDTGAARNVTLEAIADLVRDRRPVIVQDAKSGADVSLDMLTQIIRGNV